MPEPTEFLIAFTIHRRRDGENDFTEIGFGSSGAWTDIDACDHDVSSMVTRGEWETSPGMPDPDDVMREIEEGKQR